MSNWDILCEMIKDSARVKLEAQYGKAFVRLSEPNERNSSVTIAGLPDDAVVIKVDKFRSPDAIFAGSKGECRRADYMIVASRGAKKRVLFIELKKTGDNREHIVQQLKGALCFLQYCREIGKIFWRKQDFLKEYQHRFVCFGHTGSIPKRRTRYKSPSKVHDRPENLLKVDWAGRVEYEQLAGK